MNEEQLKMLEELKAELEQKEMDAFFDLLDLEPSQELFIERTMSNEDIEFSKLSFDEMQVEIDKGFAEMQQLFEMVA